MGVELTPSEVQEETLHVVETISSICQKSNSSWFTFYGSLIGAVRHRGFIPWDDDFDIAMLRADFDRFVDYCHSHEDALKAEGYRLIDKSNSPDYPFNIPRFCDIRYRMETKEYPDAGMGVFVDIYPLDSVGDDPVGAEKRVVWKKKLYTICAASASLHKPIESRGGAAQKLIKYALYLYSRNKNAHEFFYRFDRLPDRFNKDGRYVACLVWEMDFCAYPKEWFDTLIDVPFESITVKIPQEYDRILRAYYGDYTTLPPEEERRPTHDYKLFRKESE